MWRVMVVALVAGLLACLGVSSQEVKKEEEKKETKEEKKERPGAAWTDAEFLESYTKYALLVYYPSVHEELKLTPSQLERLRKVDGKLLQFKEEQKKSLQELPPPEDPAEKAQRRAHARLAQRTFRTEVVEAGMVRVLDRDQGRRLDEILLQAEGPAAFLRPEVQDRLNMDPGQIEGIREVIDRGRNAVEKTRNFTLGVEKYIRADPEKTGKILVDPDHTQDVKAAMTKRHEERVNIRKSLYASIARVLTKRQRTLYDKMCGEPFDIAALHRVSPSALLESKEHPESEERTRSKSESESEGTATRKGVDATERAVPPKP
jgi:hypothetical protein